MASLVTYAGFRSTQGVGRQMRPSCYAVYRAELHEGAGDCDPQCIREGAALPHVDCVNGETLAALTPIPEPRWTTIEVARLFETDDAPAFDFGR